MVKTTNITDEDFKMEHIKISHLNAQDLAILLRSNGIKIKNKTIKDLPAMNVLNPSLRLKDLLTSAQSPTNPLNYQAN